MAITTLRVKVALFTNSEARQVPTQVAESILKSCLIAF